MNLKLRSVRLIAILMVFALAAAACSGTEESPVVADDAPVVSEPVATTAPLEVPVEETINLPEADPEDFKVVEGESELAATSEYETIVLHVKDEVHPEQIIQTFSNPTGAKEDLVDLVDVNEIDGQTLSYPLTGTTYFDNRLALMVEEFDITGNYALVHVPVRPNGTTVWVQKAFFTEERHDYHIEVDIPTNTVSVFKGGEVIKESSAVTGRDSRPTPVLRSYIDEKIPGASISPAFGSWILSVAAFSESLGSFDGGTPKLALHGTNQEDLIGQSVSSGCVRLPNDIIEFIADTVPVGTPVDFIR